MMELVEDSRLIMDEKLLKALDKLQGEPASALQDERPFRNLLYGDFGVGKTTLAALTAQALGQKTALFATDSNWVVVLKHPEVAALIYKYDFEGFTQIKAFAQAHLEGIEPFASFGTLIWDTVSTGCLTVRNNLVKLKKFNDQRDPDVAGWTHFNLLSMMFEEVLTDLRKTNLNIIYTTHLREPSEEDRKKKRFAIRSNMPWATYELLAQEVPLIGWVYKDQGKRMVQFEPTLSETGKSQISTIEEKTYLANDVPELIAKWRNS